MFLKRRPKNEDLRPKTPWTKTKTPWTKTKRPLTKTKTPWTKLKRRPLGLKRRPHGLKRRPLGLKRRPHWLMKRKAWRAQRSSEWPREAWQSKRLMTGVVLKTSTKRVRGARSWGLGEEGVHCHFYGSTLYCLQSAFSLKIRRVLIPASAIANHDVTLQ